MRSRDRGLDSATISDDRPGRPSASIRDHDRDTIYAEGVDRTLEAMGLPTLKTLVRGCARLQRFLRITVRVYSVFADHKAPRWSSRHSRDPRGYGPGGKSII